jgi:CheY-like chemotaxis protein
VARLREFYRKKEVKEKFLPVNLQELVKQVVLMTQPKWKDQTQSKGITIRVEMSLGLGPTILGNEATLREALTNLIFNAVDAMPNGGTLKLQSRSEANGVLLEISDSGVGMTIETASRCFEPFFTTKEKNGTGLGLAMVHGIIRRHDGEIEVQSQPGQGTTFSIRLPYPKETQVESKPQPVTEPKKIKPLRILVVDDDEMVLKVMLDYLKRDGHEVQTATNGATALEFFMESRFDLVITDRSMPVLSGDQLAAKIKKIASGTPIIMLTGFGEIMKAKNEIVPDVDWVMSKPATIETIREVLGRLTEMIRPDLKNPA